MDQIYWLAQRLTREAMGEAAETQIYNTAIMYGIYINGLVVAKQIPCLLHKICD